MKTSGSEWTPPPTGLESVLGDLSAHLDDLRRGGLSRRLQTPQGIDFSSNDYLALSQHPGIRQRVAERLAQDGQDAAVGAPASRLLRGHLESHARLERRLAAFKGTEGALVYPSGWQANIGLLTALLRPGDRVLSDRLNHASLIDGIRLSGCSKVIFPHLDHEAVALELARPWSGRTFLVTESLFSMDGDLAPLSRYADLCDAHGAALIVDDAHATGLWGRRGSGWVEECGVVDRTLAIVSTGGKALGTGCGFVAGSQTLIDYLVNVSRSFIFSTAVSPISAFSLEAALEILQSEPHRRADLHRNADRLRQTLRDGGLGPDRLPEGSRGPIVPVVVGGNDEAVAAAQSVQEAGFDVRAIRPPTVAEGTARLRISVHADHTEAQIDGLAREVLKAVQSGSAKATMGLREVRS